MSCEYFDNKKLPQLEKGKQIVENILTMSGIFSQWLVTFEQWRITIIKQVMEIPEVLD